MRRYGTGIFHIPLPGPLHILQKEQSSKLTMGTRGYKAWRFRKRYYVQYNSMDSYPEGLGTWIAQGIPTGRKDYIKWLEAQRTEMKERDACLDRYLAVEPNSKQSESGDDEEPDESAIEFIAEDQPIWIVPLNDLFIEWVYIIDLDREIFSVNNGAHYKLDRIPHINWIESLANGLMGDKISLPFIGDDMASLVAEAPKEGSRERVSHSNSPIITFEFVVALLE